MESILEDSEAEAESYLTDRVTHVIATEIDHPEIVEAKDLFELPVVSVSFQLKWCPFSEGLVF